MPVSGCPRSNFTWKTGWRFQDTEDKDPQNGRSPVLHVEGLVRDSSVNRSFCMKTSGAGNADATRWPKGRNPVLNALLLKVERSYRCIVCVSEGWGLVEVDVDFDFDGPTSFSSNTLRKFYIAM